MRGNLREFINSNAQPATVGLSPIYSGVELTRIKFGHDLCLKMGRMMVLMEGWMVSVCTKEKATINIKRVMVGLYVLVQQQPNKFMNFKLLIVLATVLFLAVAGGFGGNGGHSHGHPNGHHGNDQRWHQRPWFPPQGYPGGNAGCLGCSPVIIPAPPIYTPPPIYVPPVNPCSSCTQCVQVGCAPIVTPPIVSPPIYNPPVIVTPPIINYPQPVPPIVLPTPPPCIGGCSPVVTPCVGGCNQPVYPLWGVQDRHSTGYNNRGNRNWGWDSKRPGGGSHKGTNRGHSNGPIRNH